MLNKIKEQILHILRKLCGYYELEREFKYRINEIKILKDLCLGEKKTIMNNFNDAMVQLDKLSAKHEAKILEYDILDNKYKTIVDVYTNNRTLNNHYDIEEIVKVGVNENSYNYKKYLIAELEQILTIMKEKGIHPQDLIKRILNKAKRDLKE